MNKFQRIMCFMLVVGCLLLGCNATNFGLQIGCLLTCIGTVLYVLSFRMK